MTNVRRCVLTTACLLVISWTVSGVLKKVGGFAAWA